MTFGAWNVRTLLDRDGNACPERKTAIVARELHRYNVDVAALSETHLPDEGELVEVGGGYTFFWKGTAASETRRSGVGFAIKNHLSKRLEEYPVHISDRVTTLRLHQGKDNYLNVISVYAPTLDKSDDIKDKFYEELTYCLDSINAREQVLLMGDFNARVGRDYEAWPGVLGKHGVGNMNNNGQLLLSLCAQHGLAITNTMFRLAAKYKTTWMHPRSKHWHLIDYAIVRQKDFGQVQVTRVMRGAHCWSDHRLIVTKLRICPRRPRRSLIKKPASLNVDKLKDLAVREKYAEALSEKLLPVNEVGDVDAAWGTLSSHIMDTASTALGNKFRRNEDWFDENDEILRAVFDKHRDLLRQHKRQRGSVAVVKASDLELRNLTRHMKDKWWQDKASHMQWLTDTNQLGEFYSEVRKLIGTSYQARVPLRSLDGSHLLTSKEDVLKRWAEHFNTLLNVDRSADLQSIGLMPQLPLAFELDEPLLRGEVITAIRQQQNKRTAGIDLIPGELIKYGGDELHTLMWEL
ncbi:hypothetical protein K1T71_000300 [Dendrolimus kikuchii]|uniref:Uncharacterized protein n=1 Tax=Dendrolimus kikuchii TaxID=765133 RepID=A0ACC1DKD8_9NEOP|nr:hypothetical protein K1T71_000300 [Dendrolimus kikuchii]